MDGTKPEDSAVINMENVEEIQFDDIKRTEPSPDESVYSKTSDYLLSTFSATMWQEGRKRAENAIKPFASVDLLRPYFDVEPNDIVRRLAKAFIPQTPSVAATESVPAELYGPTMICFTLVALLLHEMKSSGHRVAEGTLMGSALLTVFGYWLGVSAILWTVAYLCSVPLRPIQINTVLGYGMIGHCLVVMFSTLIHIFHTHAFFYVLWLVIGGMTALRMISVFASRTEGKSERIVIAVVIVLFHMSFLLYLHFAYHEVVKEISKAMES